MNLGITINFDDTYEIENIRENLSKFQFTAVDRNENQVTLHVSIENNSNHLVPAVFNLAFGPLNAEGRIDDKAVIKHKYSSKVYSTLLLGALTFLNANRGSYIGIDGSNLVRACLYYKLLQNNYDFLNQYFDLIGIKYYIRLLRGKEKEDPLSVDNDDLAMQPFKIPKNFSIQWEKMYNYFVFCLIDPNGQIPKF